MEKSECCQLQTSTASLTGLGKTLSYHAQNIDSVESHPSRDRTPRRVSRLGTYLICDNLLHLHSYTTRYIQVSRKMATNTQTIVKPWPTYNSLQAALSLLALSQGVREREFAPWKILCRYTACRFHSVQHSNTCRAPVTK